MVGASSRIARKTERQNEVAMLNKKTKFRVKVEKMWKGQWSFGACLSHGDDETYILINLFKWSVSIGKLHGDVEFEFDADEWII